MALKVRVIPVLLLKAGLIVRSEEFKYHQVIGDPTTQLTRYSTWSVDELVYLDISREGVYDVRRSDARIDTAGKSDPIAILSEIARHCFAPLTFGGNIRSLDDMRLRFAHGADKVAINTLAIERPEAIGEAASIFGRQAIVVSIDVRRHADGRCEVFTGGRTPAGRDPVSWARDVEARGAGEILLNSIDRDGTARGFDLDLVRAVVDATTIPVIALGGAGRWIHMQEAVTRGGAAAVAAANIFHFTEMSYKQAKRALRDAGVNVRMPWPAAEPYRAPRQENVTR